MDEQTVTVEIDSDHTFEMTVSGDRDPVSEATAVFGGTCVVEERRDGFFTVHPVRSVTAVYVGEVPSRRVGFPTIPSP